MNHIKTSTTIALSLLLVAFSVSAALAQSDKGKEMSERHKSNVANVVKDLTDLAGKDKNIGALRSEVVTTQNSIDRLTKAKERAIDDSVKADLDTQIKALEETNTNALNFIKTNESKFSVFGWFVRLFQ